VESRGLYFFRIDPEHLFYSAAKISDYSKSSAISYQRSWLIYGHSTDRSKERKKGFS
jgi:hypothetical protein